MEEQNQKEVIAQYLGKDAEILKENGVAPHDVQEQQVGSFKNHYWKFVGGFLAIIIVSIIAIPFIGDYMDKQKAQAKKDQYAASDKAMHDLQDRLKNDKDGGATPEETLNLFIVALKKGDIAQAEKYFVIYPEDRQASLVNLMKQLQNVGEMSKFIEYLGKVKQEKGDDLLDGNIRFTYLNQEGKIDISVEITKGKYSTVWKIESFML